MADYTNSKPFAGAAAPYGAIATPWGRLEPLITPEQLRVRMLFGIPLMTRMVDPVTKRAIVMTDDMLKDFIHRAVDKAELETSLTLMPTQFQEKLPYSRLDFEQFGYFKLSQHPATSIESLSIQLADGGDVFNFPLEWVDTANLLYGQVNLIPLAYQTLTAGMYNAPGTGMVGYSGNGVFFNNLWNKDNVPALMNFQYTAGFRDGLMPSYINELVGIIAAMNILSQLGAINAKTTGQSLSVDGLSQSVSGTGPNIYVQRLTELKEERAMITKKIRSVYQSNFTITAI